MHIYVWMDKHVYMYVYISVILFNFFKVSIQIIASNARDI